MELNNFKVSSGDPFLNATKWNGTLEFSRNFENMISSMLGTKFKGIYKPENKYEIGDYVWFEDACYIISNKQSLKVTTKQVESPVIAFKSKNGFYALKNNKITNFTNGGEETKSILKSDTFFYHDSKSCFYSCSFINGASRLYKIDANGKSESMSANLLTDIKEFSVDDFAGYVLAENDTMKKFSLVDASKHTQYENVQFSSNYPIIHFDVDNDNVYALNNNGDFMVINKTGGVIGSTSLKNQFTNINLVKFAVSESKTVAFSDNNEIKIYAVEKNILRFSYKMNGGIGKIDNLTYSNKHFTYNNDSAVGYVIASQYDISPADMRSLISTSSTIEVKGALLSLDFGRSQLVSNGETVVEPKGFKFDSKLTNNNIYDDGVNKVQFIGDRGIQLHGNKLAYPFLDLFEKVLICEFDSAAPNVEFASLPIGQNSVNLITSTKTISGKFKTAYELAIDKVRVTVSSADSIIETFTIPVNDSKKTEMKFESSGNVVLSKLILSSKIEKTTIDFLLNCSYVISDHYKNDFLPIPSNNQNGARFIKGSDKSIINTENGIKVNFSADSNLNDNEIGLNTAGGKRLFDLIQNIKNEVDNNFSQKDHKHKFAELQEVPLANVNGTKGIVSLNNSRVDSNQSTAASSLAVKTVNDGVIEATRIANTKLASAPGTTSSFYLRHSAGISGDLAQVLKDGKTGMFNGNGLTNGLPWGSHPFKYYFANSHANSAGYTGIIGLDFDGTEMGYTSVCNGAFKPWRRLWSSANFDPNTKSDNHSHPYLSSSGGTLGGNLRVNGGYLDIAKSGTNSMIRFDAQSNDPGYIMHYESNNSSNMRFCVSDDRARQDYFSWGSSQGGGYSQCAYMYTDGYLHTDSDIHSSGNIVAFSDRRLKENIIKIEKPLEITEQLNGVIFDRIDNGIRQTGLIAQDVLKVLPEAVTEDDKGYYSVNYGSLVGLLVESIKELKARVIELENKK